MAFDPPSERQQEVFDAAVSALRANNDDLAITALLSLADDRVPNSEIRASGVLLLSELYHQQGQADRALELLESLRETTPPNAELEYVLGRTYMVTQQYVEAEDALRRAIRRDADYLRAYLALGSMLASNGRDADAEEVMLGFEREVYRMGDELVAETTTLERRLELIVDLDTGTPDGRLTRALVSALQGRAEVRAAALAALAHVATIDGRPAVAAIAANPSDPLAAAAAQVVGAIDLRASATP